MISENDFAAITAGIAFGAAGVCAFLGMVAPNLGLVSALLLIGGIWLLDENG